MTSKEIKKITCIKPLDGPEHTIQLTYDDDSMEMVTDCPKIREINQQGTNDIRVDLNETLCIVDKVTILYMNGDVKTAVEHNGNVLLTYFINPNKPKKCIDLNPINKIINQVNAEKKVNAKNEKEKSFNWCLVSFLSTMLIFYCIISWVVIDAIK